MIVSMYPEFGPVAFDDCGEVRRERGRQSVTAVLWLNRAWVWRVMRDHDSGAVERLPEVLHDEVQLSPVERSGMPWLETPPPSAFDDTDQSVIVHREDRRLLSDLCIS